jgi:hypothetical protein
LEGVWAGFGAASYTFSSCCSCLPVSHATFGGKKAPQLAETIDLPQAFEIDFQFAAKQIPPREICVYSGRGSWN